MVLWYHSNVVNHEPIQSVRHPPRGPPFTRLLLWRRVTASCLLRAPDPWNHVDGRCAATQSIATTPAAAEIGFHGPPYSIETASCIVRCKFGWPRNMRPLEHVLFAALSDTRGRASARALSRYASSKMTAAGCIRRTLVGAWLRCCFASSLKSSWAAVL